MTALVVLDALPLAPGAAGPSRTMTAGGRAAVPAGGRRGRIESPGARRRGAHRARPAARAAACRQRTTSPRSLAALGVGQSHRVHRSPQRQSGVDGYGPHPFRRPERPERQDGLHRRRPRAACQGRDRQPGARRRWWRVQQARLSDGTVLRNLDVLLQKQPGWLGIKTGWTGAAGGCLLFAARDAYGSAPNLSVTVWGAILGQPAMTAAGSRLIRSSAQRSPERRARSAAVLGSYRAVNSPQSLPAVTGIDLDAAGAARRPWCCSPEHAAADIRAGAGPVDVPSERDGVRTRSSAAGRRTVGEVNGVAERRHVDHLAGGRIERDRRLRRRGGSSSTAEARAAHQAESVRSAASCSAAMHLRVTPGQVGRDAQALDAFLRGDHLELVQSEVASCVDRCPLYAASGARHFWRSACGDSSPALTVSPAPPRAGKSRKRKALRPALTHCSQRP